jgi:hypothetical protein
MSVNFSYEVSFVLQGFLTRRKISRRGADGFTSPPKEVMLRIFIVLKNPLSFAGFEPASLESMASTLPQATEGGNSLLSGVYLIIYKSMEN